MHLGRFWLGQRVVFRVTWTRAAGEPGISGSSLRLTHDDGTVIGPLVAAGAGDGPWSASAEPTKPGRWHVEWETTPEGGVTRDTISIS